MQTNTEKGSERVGLWQKENLLELPKHFVILVYIHKPMKKANFLLDYNHDGIE